MLVRQIPRPLQLLQLLWVPVAFSAKALEQEVAGFSRTGCSAAEDVDECLAETAEALAAGGSDALACEGSLGGCPLRRHALMQLASRTLPPAPAQEPPDATAGASDAAAAPTPAKAAPARAALAPARAAPARAVPVKVAAVAEEEPAGTTAKLPTDPGAAGPEPGTGLRTRTVREVGSVALHSALQHPERTARPGVPLQAGAPETKVPVAAQAPAAVPAAAEEAPAVEVQAPASSRAPAGAAQTPAAAQAKAATGVSMLQRALAARAALASWSGKLLGAARKAGGRGQQRALVLLQAISERTGTSSAVLGFWGVFLLLILVAVCTAFAASCRRSMAYGSSNLSPPLVRSPQAQGSEGSLVTGAAKLSRMHMLARGAASACASRSAPMPTPRPAGAASASHTAATLPGSSEVGGDPESHYIGTPGTSLIGPVQYLGTPAPSSPLPSVPPPPPPMANPKRFCPQLCPGLVVPRGSECVLAVQPPQPPARGAKEASAVTVEVLDLRGKPVLRATVSRPLQWPQVSHEAANSAVPWATAKGAPAMTLRMLQPVGGPGHLPQGSRLFDSSVLSICRAGVTPDGLRQMFVYDANSRLFGRLAKDPTRSRYVLTSSRGEGAIFFDGLFRDNAVLIANDHQEQLADSEPCSMAFNPQGKFFRLRVSSGVDVGLMLVGLVCISEMEDPQSQDG